MLLIFSIIPQYFFVSVYKTLVFAFFSFSTLINLYKDVQVIKFESFHVQICLLVGFHLNDNFAVGVEFQMQNHLFLWMFMILLACFLASNNTYEKSADKKESLISENMVLIYFYSFIDIFNLTLKFLLFLRCFDIETVCI